MAKKTITIYNISNQPITFNIKSSPNSEIFTGSGMTTLAKGKFITVEETRINFSVLKNMARLGLVKTAFATQKDEVVVPGPVAVLDLSFTYAIGGPATSMDPDDVITGLAPVEFTLSAIVVTNDGDLDANVTAAVLSPASNASVNGFSSSIIANGSTNSFNLSWGGANPFDEDLTITINGTGYLFTFQGNIAGGGA